MLCWFTSMMRRCQRVVPCHLHGIFFLRLGFCWRSLKIKWHCLQLFGLLSQLFGLLPIPLVRLTFYYRLTLHNSRFFLWCFEFLLPLVRWDFLIDLVLMNIVLYQLNFVFILEMVNVVGVLEVNVVDFLVLSSRIMALIYCIFFSYNLILCHYTI